MYWSHKKNCWIKNEINWSFVILVQLLFNCTEMYKIDIYDKLLEEEEVEEIKIYRIAEKGI